MSENCRQCPKCKTSEHQNRNLVMMLNECCHPICQNCMENLFARNVAPCPYEACGKMLKKSGFWVQEFDDPRVERENFIRKKINKIFNLQEDDFHSLNEYNNYLEKVEDIVFKLANEFDVDDTEVEIKAFKDANSEAIERNKRRQTKDDQWIRAMLDEEMARKQKLQHEHVKEELEKDKNKVLFNPKSVINELRSSDLPAQVVLDRQRKKHIEVEMAEKEEAIRRKRDKEEEKQRTKDRIIFGTVKLFTGKPYQHELSTLPLNGPLLLDEEKLAKLGYLEHVRQPTASALAGGFHARLGCQRALLEAYADLFGC